MRQPDLFDGRALRDSGIELVRSHTPISYADNFEAAVFSFAAGTLLTSEDIRDIVGDPPNHLNAIGAQMHRCVSKGWLKKIGFRQAKRRDAHARIIGLYQRV